MNELDLTTQQDVVSYMSLAESESDWNNRCGEVKRANGGYPSFWFMAVVMSGLADKTAKGWGGNADIQVESI